MKCFYKTAVLFMLVSGMVSANTLSGEKAETTATTATSPAPARSTETMNISDPLSVYTGGDISFGTKELGASFQFGAVKGDWGLMGKIEGKNNFDTYRARVFTPYYKTGTGLYIDAGGDNSDGNISSRYATAGFLQVIPINKKLKLYPGLTYGKQWEKDDKFEDTNIVRLTVYGKYDLNKQIYFVASPQYTYGFNGEETRNSYMEMSAGYRLDKDSIFIFTGSSDGDAWLTYKFRFH